VKQLVKSINKGSQGRLIVDQIENIGPYYSKTLRLWKERLQPVLVSEHFAMIESDVRLFRRKWERLLKFLAPPSVPASDDVCFTYCEAGFNTKTLGDVIMTTSREGVMEMLDPCSSETFPVPQPSFSPGARSSDR
jgi:cyclopropane-fatty-acyl-phospholipid synthase